jgi:hypothetical protein
MRHAVRYLPCLALLAACSGSHDAPASLTYATEFTGTENPLSEGGVWSHSGLDWTAVRTSDGFAYGTQSGRGGYDDSYARLSGFPANQVGEATVQLKPFIDASCSHEIEILLRWSDSAHSATGYEANISFGGGYAQIVRWNGGLGAFTVLAGGRYRALRSGDTFKAEINGNAIAIYANDTKLAEVTDNTYATGNPGIGFFRGNCGAGADFGMSSFKVTGTGG